MSHPMFAVMLEKIGIERRFLVDEEFLIPLFGEWESIDDFIKKTFTLNESLQVGDFIYVVSVTPDETVYSKYDCWPGVTEADSGVPEVRSVIRKYGIAVQPPLKHSMSNPKKFLMSITLPTQYFAPEPDGIVAEVEIANA